jgi:predicted double-glycine peptidase
MINVPYLEQKTPFSCGPATLNMVFRFYGIEKTEEELTIRLRTNKHIGTLHSDMVRVAREEGFYVFENEESSIVEIEGLLKMRIPVIVHFTEPSENDNHYAVVVQVDDTHLVFNDPWNGEKTTLEIDDFVSRWSSEHTSEDNWLIAISKESFSLGRQYSPLNKTENAM